jgi:hypothetical protein
MAILPKEGDPITYTQIQNYISTYYSVNSTSLRTLSQTDGKSAPDRMSEFFADSITIWARNRYTLFNISNTITVYWKISPSVFSGGWNTLSTKEVTTTYGIQGTLLLDRPSVNSTNRLWIGIAWNVNNSAQFGVGLNGTNWTTYCGTLSPYRQTSTTLGPIYLNINVDGPNGQYVSCG